MLNKQNSQPPKHANRFNSRGPNTNYQAPEESKGIDLFPIAVFIMGIVSCYTTATGLYPMLDNWILSYATAIALSVFMVAIALRIPKAYEEGNQGKLIMGYIFVASFSVLLNFNAIYGVFTAEKLLYEELKENKTSLSAMQVSSRGALDKYFDTREIEEKLSAAQALLKEETSNRVDPGYGKKARQLNQEVVIPLQAKMEAMKARYDPAVALVDSLVLNAQADIDEALNSGKIKEYRLAVDRSIDAYSQIGEKTTNLVGDENFSYEPLVFQHRDVGNLNHSLWTLTNVSQLNGKQASAVIVSMLLALLIDFIVLFVIVMINRPATKKTENKEDEEKATVATRSSFKGGNNTTPSHENNSIYAVRRSRNGSPKPLSERPQTNPDRMTTLPERVRDQHRVHTEETEDKTAFSSVSPENMAVSSQVEEEAETQHPVAQIEIPEKPAVPPVWVPSENEKQDGQNVVVAETIEEEVESEEADEVVLAEPSVFQSLQEDIEEETAPRLDLDEEAKEEETAFPFIWTQKEANLPEEEEKAALWNMEKGEDQETTSESNPEIQSTNEEEDDEFVTIRSYKPRKPANRKLTVLESLRDDNLFSIKNEQKESTPTE
ncbi:MAG: hypothetical protein AAFY71_09485 [Bacteroidota bacterium]